MDGHAIDAQVGSKILLEGNYFNNVCLAMHSFLRRVFLNIVSGEDPGAAFDWPSVRPGLRRGGFCMLCDYWKEMRSKYQVSALIYSPVTLGD